MIEATVMQDIMYPSFTFLLPKIISFRHEIKLQINVYFDLM